MDARIAQLETHIDYMRENMAEFRNEMREFRIELKETTRVQQEITKSVRDLKTLIERLPTKDDLWSFKLKELAILFAAFATIVGGIVGGLDWIKVH